MGTPPFGENQITIHGTLVRNGNEGILFRGEAGVGKSTAALELMTDGGQLVADDVVVIRRVGNELYGTAPRLLKGILAIPEFGIFDVREVIGGKYFTPSTLITRCVNLGWLAETIDRETSSEFHGLKVPRSYRQVSRDRKPTEFPLGVDLLAVKKSEARILRGHGKVLASTRAR